MNFIIENKDMIIVVVVALGIPTALAKMFRRMVERMPTKWHVVNDKLVLKGFDRILRYIFGTSAMLANAQPHGEEAAKLLFDFGNKYIKQKSIKINNVNG